MNRCTTVIIGPDEHGVVRHAASIAAAAGTQTLRAFSPDELAAGPLRTPIAHWHYTDRLFALTAPAAAEAFERCRGVLGARRNIITLHDIPEPEHPPDRRRIGPYRRVAAGAERIVVASNHEAARLQLAGINTPITVIPLPIPLPIPPPIAPCRVPGRMPCASVSMPARSAPVTVGVLGFLYPGKGHAELLAAGLPANCEIVVIGTVSPGHNDLVPRLRLSAANIGCALRITGWLTDAQLGRALAAIDVPVVPATRVSASASLATWIAQGRRPLVARNDFTAELHQRADLFTLYDPANPAAQYDAIQRALAIPRSTWRQGPIPEALTLPAVAAAHAQLYRP